MSKNSGSVPVATANTPVNIAEHQDSLEARQQARNKKRAKLLSCLDPIVARDYEHRKPLYEFKIECKIFRAAGSKGRARNEKFDEQVVAQNEDDAWSMFCDKIGEWPSRRDTMPKITRLQKRTLDNED